MLVLLNDRIPDGRDVSWIWDVDFELLMGPADRIIVSGDRAYDMAIRLKYAGEDRATTQGSECSGGVTVIPDLGTAIERAVQETAPGNFLFILPTYSAMLEARNILTGDEFKLKTT